MFVPYMHTSILFVLSYFFFFFFNDTATTEIYTLSLHDALPISARAGHAGPLVRQRGVAPGGGRRSGACREPAPVHRLSPGAPLLVPPGQSRPAGHARRAPVVRAERRPRRLGDARREASL